MLSFRLMFRLILWVVLFIFLIIVSLVIPILYIVERSLHFYQFSSKFELFLICTRRWKRSLTFVLVMSCFLKFSHSLFLLVFVDVDVRIGFVWYFHFLQVLSYPQKNDIPIDIRAKGQSNEVVVRLWFPAQHLSRKFQKHVHFVFKNDFEDQVTAIHLNHDLSNRESIVEI